MFRPPLSTKPSRDNTKYNEYLRSYDGERKSEREAEVIATDVSKFLRYASEKVDWLHTTNPQKVQSYLEYLEKKAACGVDGCLTKLQRISKVLSYVTQELYPNNEKLYFRCQQVAERYSKWRRVLQKERTLKSKLRLEKVSNEPRSATNQGEQRTKVSNELRSATNQGEQRTKVSNELRSATNQGEQRTKVSNELR